MRTATGYMHINKTVFKRMWYVSALLGISSNNVEAMVTPLNANVYITHHAASNAIAYTCQTMCEVTSSNVLGKLVQDYLWYEQKWWDRGRWVGTPKGPFLLF